MPHSAFCRVAHSAFCWRGGFQKARHIRDKRKLSANLNGLNWIATTILKINRIGGIFNDYLLDLG